MKYRLSLLAVLLVGSLTLTACTSKVVTQNDDNQANQNTDITNVPVEPVKPVASVTVAGEVALVNNTVSIDKVVSVGPGWMTIHADKNGTPGDVIGHTAVVDGDNTNVVVTIDPKKATPKLYAMLHVDAGVVGTYEFPGADVPALANDGSMISPAFMTKKDTIATKPQTRTFNVKGLNFSFDTKEISVNKGDTVVINFTNTEGFHDWVIDEFKARTKQIGEGKSETITFVADKAGTFEYYCSVGKHRAMGMKGNLIVK